MKKIFLFYIFLNKTLLISIEGKHCYDNISIQCFESKIYKNICWKIKNFDQFLEYLITFPSKYDCYILSV